MKHKVICRYIGLDPKLEEAIKAVTGRDPDQVEFGYPSVGGDVYRIRILTFNMESPEAAQHLSSLLAPIAGVEQYVA